MMRWLCALLLPAWIAGCATAPEVTHPIRHEASQNANQQARVLYARGDFTGAVKQAQRALALATSIEDEDAIAASLLNLSLIYQRLDRPTEARQAVERILDGGGLSFSPQRVAEAALRRAVLATDDGETEKAESLLLRTEQACTPVCSLSGKVHNVRAQLSIERGELDEALKWAEKALAENRMRHDEEETANAQRLAANALILSGRPTDAQTRLAEALAIDKRLGASRKVYRDLLLSGIAARRGGSEDLARTFFTRARDVARADAYAAGTEEAESLLKASH
jgi:tetratricopeptide (TPR) repeat protein